MVAPDVVIAGAAKCGTTALAAALGAHPDFTRGRIKETAFYAGIEPNRRGPLAAEFNAALVTTQAAYDANFVDARGRRLLDASTDYLANPGSAERIRAANPKALIIIGLRHPVRRAWSEHLHLLRSDAEPLGFMDALHAEEQRVAQRYMPLFHHVGRSLYAPGIKAFHTAFGRERVYIYLHEELRAKPDRITGDLTEFLGASEAIRMVGDFNIGGAPKSAFINRALRGKTGPLYALRKTLSRMLPPAAKRRIRDGLDSVNLDRSLAVSEDAHRWIMDRVAEDLAEVETLTGRDLSAWRAPWSPAT